MMATNRPRKVAVVGAGVIGLSSAYKILQENPSVELTVFYEKSSPETTGDVSAGWIYPSKVKGKEVDVKRWYEATFKHLSSLYKQENSLEIGVSAISGFVFDPPPFIFSTCGERLREVTDNEKETFIPFDWKKKYKSVYFYTTWTCECSFYLPWLMQQIENLNGKFVKTKITRFEELSDFDIVVNCSGLGARSLVPDDKVYPVKGQVFNVVAPWIKYFYRFADELYILPKLRDVVVGGTRDERDQTLNPIPSESARIWKDCCEHLPSLKRAQIVTERVGFRPTRQPVRLEVDPDSPYIVHNYGHGGSGVTLHWGCAIEVNDIVTGLLAKMTSLTPSKL